MQVINDRQCVVDRSLHLTDFEIEYDVEQRILWGFFNPHDAPSFTSKLLTDIHAHDRLLESIQGSIFHRVAAQPIDYYVWGSRIHEVFSLGGDLAYFVQCIESRDRNALMRYATRCIDSLYLRIRNYFSHNLITVSLVQGDALGGGFEAALASDVIVAEEQVKFGLPEILFNLFPGMGAYSLLSRRVGSRQAEEMMLSGDLYSAASLYKMGLVDILVPEGQGVSAVYEYVQKNQRRRNGVAAIHQARKAVFPVTREELMTITIAWVDAALRLQAKDLRMMTRLARSQSRLMPSTSTETFGTENLPA
ncbi:crotonase/enoyl-CoA hydratase family protein [Collimonas sp. NPDC087041]|uniref:crotonase/enoyl-CoA hydratase family protein n=1 Tax=Collimonas sp. NPDC087041 TaxID=3363960 RepID=UPI0038258121